MRSALKRQLARLAGGAPASGATLLTYHRVGGGSSDELDVAVADFEDHVRAVSAHDVVPIDDALDRLDAGDDRPCVVLTFDDGFADVHAHAWPRLRAARLPFTIYLTAGLVGSERLSWEGSTAGSTGPALTWEQLEEMVASGLCTVANHTFDHPRPDHLDEAQLDRCSGAIEERLGARPRHFTYTWGIEVPAMRAALADRFRSVSTGALGRNHPGADRLALRRVPVRRTDPLPFFEAKLRGSLVPERVYGSLVTAAKWGRSVARPRA